VGCILVNKYDHVLSTGYNGPDAGATNCTDVPCEGATCPSGTGLTKCQAIHAEMNALLQCRDTQAIKTAFCTTQPCEICMGMLLNTSCERIVYVEDYAASHGEAIQRWKSRGRQIVKADEIVKHRDFFQLFTDIYGFKL
ncbi:MAG: hypothetical protein LC687_01080, partial [Actinobacteria bacterium]|nr:hypothetical protein [Actinomycetota bacterium]